MFYDHFCAQSRLNGLSRLQRQRSEVEDETPFGYAHVEAPLASFSEKRANRVHPEIQNGPNIGAMH